LRTKRFVAFPLSLSPSLSLSLSFDESLTHPFPSHGTCIWTRPQARKIFIQPNTFLSKGGKDVVLKEYALTVKGKIESFVERDV